MRILPILAVFLLALVYGGTRAEAEEAWCAHYLNGDGTNCGFATFEQCEADISGVGGYCSPNPAS